MELMHGRVHVVKPDIASGRFLDLQTVRGINGFHGEINGLNLLKSLNGTQATNYFEKLSPRLAAESLVDREVAVLSHERDLLVMPVKSIDALRTATIATPVDMVFDAA